MDQDQVSQQDELETLKHRATMLGITFHPSIGLAKLREKVAERMAESSDSAGGDEGDEGAGQEAAAAEETPTQKRMRLRREATELVRVRVTCMNPMKKEWQGEVFTVGNNAVGTIKKFVPFNADEGWHVPRMILQMMQDRMCQVFVTTKTRNGVSMRSGKLIKEFAIEILPALTEVEIAELARRQAMAAGQAA